ncbi:methylmalonyl-CoA mutase family protein [Micromonospora craniellae]|uniref:Methylmalonyl-CoA mutase alpha/beta chain catalytic domain-containing protein n=1 Tax=Micromonospora craniellae TaxID=2294034 RepID=A0A372FY72_9ACTN|nr:methylmalonyl-CoA mutase family protein [Micromonospora craniellae]QOC93701.1 hypothetical protein ID554_08730 [Micromonospora craniellae]RFS45747.1 hypothetical protein D0Q02_15585 [Micromonospora craniellae]
MSERRRSSESGYPIEGVYTAAHLPGELDSRLGAPGEYPYTRGVYPTMYTSRPWTMRQYAGFGTATESNARYHQLLRAGTMGLSVAFDLPTQMGYDSDDPIAHGEVGKVGVAIDTHGRGVDDFAPRLSFFFVARTTLLEEVAKFRAARRIWARLMRDEFGAKNPKSMMLRFHTQTAGVQLTAQQPEVNLVRVAVQGLGAVLGGTQSLHTNSFDEAIALPTEKAARLALRTQQVLAYETDLTATVDPFAGSYVVEAMTAEIEAAADALMGRVFEYGSSVDAIEAGFQKREIEQSAYQIAREIDSGERVVVGLNRFTIDAEEPYEPLRVDPAIEAAQGERLAKLRAGRDDAVVQRALAELREAASGTSNVLYPMKAALRERATVGEVCGALREVWGVYRPTDRF